MVGAELEAERTWFSGLAALLRTINTITADLRWKLSQPPISHSRKNFSNMADRKPDRVKILWFESLVDAFFIG